MPELPEVETMCEKLVGWIDPGKHFISGNQVIRGKNYLPGTQAQALCGRKIIDVQRRGKFIIFKLDRGCLVCHNAMSGYWDTAEDPWTFDYVEGARNSASSDVRVHLYLNHPEGRGTLDLRFHDARLFGSLLLYDDPWEHVWKLMKLGPEPIETPRMANPAPFMSSRSFHSIFKNQKKSVKELLLDQSKVAGIGNIYSSEICWLAGVDPRRAGKTLEEVEINKLEASMSLVLNRALTSKLDYGSYLSVYRRDSCPTCLGQIIREEIKGRATFFCNSCQK